MYLPEDLNEMEKHNPKLVKNIREYRSRENILLTTIAIIIFSIILIVMMCN